MSNLGVELTAKVVKALTQYSEWQVARMYNLQIAAVRAIKIDTQRQVDDLNKRRQDDLFSSMAHDVSLTGRQIDPDGVFWKAFGEACNRRERERVEAYNHRSYVQQPNADYAGLEARVLAGFFTEAGQPTPAFWGFVANYTKKSGHAILDLLHDQQIFSPEQLEHMLDLDKRIEGMSQAEAIALLRRLTKKVYDNEFKDPGSTGFDVSDSE